MSKDKKWYRVTLLVTALADIDIQAESSEDAHSQAVEWYLMDIEQQIKSGGIRELVDSEMKGVEELEEEAAE
jgi:hypothetical protein